MIELGFTKGMSQDISPVRRDKDNYYSALNIRVVTEEGLSTGSITNDLGNTLLFKVPRLNKSAKITNIVSDSSITIKLWNAATEVYDTLGTKKVTTKLADETWCDALYRNLLAVSGVSTLIATGKLYIKNNRVELKVIILDDYVEGNTITVSGASLTYLSPGSTEYPTIVNYCQMRDSLILFTTFTSGSSGQVWKLDYDFENNTIIDLDNGWLVPNKHLVYIELLDFPYTYRTGEVLSKYNNPVYGKVYFTNGTTLRHLNILDPESLGTPLTYTELLPDVVAKAPRYVETLTGGNIKAGMIQYGYQLYNYGGAETLMSATTPLIHTVSTPITDTTTNTYRGDDIETNTGKSIKLTVNNIDLRFDSIKVWSIFYAQKGSPIINLIFEGRIKGDSIEIIDNGNVSLDTLTQAEFAYVGGAIFNPKTLTVKDNYLIAGNITEDVFDVDEEFGNYWDARAYRWKTDTSYAFKIDGVEHTTTNISETADCRTLDSDYTDGYKYNVASGIKLGGSGANISYEFYLLDSYIDTSVGNATTTLTSKVTLNYATWINNTFDNVVDFPDHHSPYNAGWMAGYQPRETYRFGIEFIDPKGRRSFVKWIGDVRIPDYSELTDLLISNGSSSVKTLAHSDGYNIKSTTIGIKFTVTNVPSGYSWRIVRVERQDKDKTVVDTAYLKHLKAYNSGDYPGYYPTLITGIAQEGSNNVWVAVSPNICFRNLSSLTGLKIEKVGYFDDYKSERLTKTDYNISMAPNYDIHAYFLKPNTFIPHADELGDVRDSIQLGVGYDAAYSLNGATLNYYNSDKPIAEPTPSHGDFYGGRGILFRASNAISQTAYKPLIVNFIRPDMDYTRYGGTTYAARSRNDYIPCSDVVTGSGSAIVFRGDTYNQMFDYQDLMSALGDFDFVDDSYIVSSVAFIPILSSLNTCLRQDTCVSKTSNSNQVWKLQDKTTTGVALYNNKSEDENTVGDYPSTYTDLYLINPVYNMQNTTVRAFAKPLNYTSNNVIDYRILSSQPSIAGEAVDSWTRFFVNDFIDLDSQYGAINKIIVNNNILMALQDTGFAAVAFKDRQLLQDELQGQLVLGTGSILSYARYISTKTGTRHQWSVIDLDSNMLWFDSSNRKLMRYTQSGLEILSDTKGMTSYFKRIYPTLTEDLFSNTIVAVANKRDNRVYFTIRQPSGGMESINDHGTISYNLMLGEFESFHSFEPYMYMDTEIGMLTVADDKSQCYLHGTTEYNTYYGTGYQSFIEHLTGNTTKISWTNLEFNSDDVAPLQLRFEDSYGNALSSGADLIRRFRTYRLAIPRHDDGSNQRFVDYWLKVKLTYSYQPTVFRLDGITIKYLIPKI